MMNSRQLKELQTVPIKYAQIVQRAYEAKSSPRGAIKAFCLYCTGYIRTEVANCTSLACPLHPFRPYQKGLEDDAEVPEAAS
jgi:hypothetical protein